MGSAAVTDEPDLFTPSDDDEPTPRRRVGRRGLLIGIGVGAVVVAGGAVGVNVLSDKLRGALGSGPSGAGVPTTTPAALPRLDGVPEPVASFGPNGTHWPGGTPWITGEVDSEVEVECSWPAIEEAIAEAVEKESADATVRILIAPGTLPGYGAGSGAPATLKDLGSVERKTRILVYPRDGYGTVTVENSWRWIRVYGVTFAGIVTQGGFMATGCSGSAFARIKVDAAYNVYGVDGVDSTENVELVEIVIPEAQLRNEDVTGMRTPTSGSGGLRYVSRIGCYTAPGYKEAGSKAHTDTVQFSGQNNNYYGDFTSIDCIDFASTNTAFQIGSAPNIRYQHCLVVGGAVGKAVYPLPDGAATDGGHGASNGPGADFGCTAVDSTFIGSMGAATWAEVTGSTVGYASTGAEPRSGEWAVDPSILDWSADDIRRLSPAPDDAYLASIWA
ncbi:hypothetical protein HQQ80_04895 [Microbacteriaceae bacterium VKM Ac-2855]|nr:hypothetical protein [Microbacteriaceae bacterium VKM Ac-2855]